MARLLIIKTGSTHSDIAARFGDFEDWFSDHLALPGMDVDVKNVEKGEALPDPETVDGVLVTGSPAMLTERQDWSEICKTWLKKAVHADKPILGICFGHHLLAETLGGRVGFHPKGREIGTQQLFCLKEVAGDPLFGHLPCKFSAQLSHMQSVLELPKGAVHLVSGDFEPHQVFRWGRHCWGCQFHPEFSREIMTAYVDSLSATMEAEGLHPQMVREKVQTTPLATAVLERFALLVSGN